MRIKVSCLILSVLSVSCAAAFPATGVHQKHEIQIYGAYVSLDPFHGGMLVEDLECPWNSIPLYLTDEIEASKTGGEFVKALRGGGELGPVAKYVVVDGVLVTEGALEAAREVRLKSVRKFREMRSDPVAAGERMDSRKGCERDARARSKWLRSLQRRRGHL